MTISDLQINQLNLLFKKSQSTYWTGSGKIFPQEGPQLSYILGTQIFTDEIPTLSVANVGSEFRAKNPPPRVSTIALFSSSYPVRIVDPSPP